MIDPNNTNTIRVGELPSEPFNLTDNIPHEVGTDLKRGTVQQLADFIASVVEVTGGVGFRAVSVTDGQTLPTTTQEEFILVGKGTYFNVAGGDTIVLTEELNALVSNGSFWFVGVEIPINVELAGITQEVREGFLNTTPSEDAVFKFIQNLDLTDKEDVANKQNSLVADPTNQRYITVTGVRTHTTDTNNPHAVTKAQVGLANVDNTSDLNKPISTATQTAIDDKINGNGSAPTIALFTGPKTIGNSVIIQDLNGNIGIGTATPFSATGFRITSINGLNGSGFNNFVNGVQAIRFISNATDSFIAEQRNLPFRFLNNGTERFRLAIGTGNALFNTTTDNAQGVIQANGNITASAATLANQVVIKSQLDLKADLASPALTGTPTAPTATAGTNTTQIATTAFVTNADSGNVKLAGTQTITGTKTFANPIFVDNQSLFFITSNVTYSKDATRSQIKRFVDDIAIASANSDFLARFNTLGLSSNRTFSFPDKTGTFSLKSDLLYTNQTITANKTVTIAEFVNNNELILSVNATSGNITITLPTFTALQGYKVTVKKMDSSANSVLITGVGGVNIDGAATLVISGQYGTSTIGANLSQYIIL